MNATLRSKLATSEIRLDELNERMGTIITERLCVLCILPVLERCYVDILTHSWYVPLLLLHPSIHHAIHKHKCGARDVHTH